MSALTANAVSDTRATSAYVFRQRGRVLKEVATGIYAEAAVLKEFDESTVKRTVERTLRVFDFRPVTVEVVYHDWGWGSDQPLALACEMPSSTKLLAHDRDRDRLLPSKSVLMPLQRSEFV